MSTTRPSEAPTRPSGVVLALLWAIWLLVPAGLVLAGVGQLLTFFGEVPTESERASARNYLLAAVTVAALVPLLGLVLSARSGRRSSAAVFAIALMVGLVAGGVILVGTADPEPVPDPDRDVGRVCQEHSGGDNRCPGG